VGLPISSHRSAGGPAVVTLKRWLRRLLHPLPQTQSDVNAATARVVMFLLRQLAEQARAIERLEAELAESRRERQP
jgi:putative heme iron utilization protein